MQVLAIERFIDEKAAHNAQTLMKQNEPHIMQLYEEGIIQAYWSRGDRPGTVLLIESDSVESVKKILHAFPLVKQKIVTYNIVPLEPYQIEQLLAEDEEILTLVYVSEESYPMNQNVLNDILEHSRKHNTKVNISGVLLYENGSFLQLLEGKENRVRALYQKICKDTRHKHVAKIIEFKSRQKSFAEWSMGYANITADELEKIEGMNDFFQNDKCFSDLNHHQIEKLLQAFKYGKYRQKIK